MKNNGHFNIILTVGLVWGSISLIPHIKDCKFELTFYYWYHSFKSASCTNILNLYV